MKWLKKLFGLGYRTHSKSVRYNLGAAPDPKPLPNNSTMTRDDYVKWLKEKIKKSQV